MKKKFYITTPIYYVNDKPHVGHFYCTLMADACARYHRLVGDEVFFVTGTDENSQKILPVAEKEGIPLREYVDRMSDRWLKTWQKLGLTFDRFIRTTSEEHRLTVESLFRKSLEKGDIYKKKYDGLYCVGCEKFLKEDDLVDGLCPVHKTKPQWIQEENYFFRLSAYQSQLLELLQSGHFALPAFRCNEMIQFVKGGLEDVSVSRSSVKWGIPLPTDPSHVFYVWYDALINYLSALDFHDPGKFKKDFWPNSVHLVGKDIFRFHTVMWPAMLLSAGLTPPRQVFGHGFFTVNGQKISKSLGNAIDPIDLTDKYGSDTLRFYILADIPFGKDSDFSTERLECLYNSYLANSYGNTVNRILNMIQRYTGGIVLPTVGTGFTEIKEKLEHLVQKTGDYYDSFKYDDFIREIFSLVSDCNKLIDNLKPWEMAKRNETTALEELLFLLFEAMRICTLLLNPIMPEKTSEVLIQCGLSGDLKGIDFARATKFGFTDSKTPISTLKQLFPRMESKGACKMDNAPDTPVNTEQQAKGPVQDSTDQTGANLLITIDDFKKVELVIGAILTAERIEGADKLLKLAIDIGTEQRTVCAGIAQFYTPEELPGKKVVLVKNLAPRKLKGILSQGMLLAAKEGETLSLLTLDRMVKAGSPVS